MNCSIFNDTNIGMIEGSNQTISVDLYNIFGEQYDYIDIVNIEWRMSKYGEIECLVSKNTASNPKEMRYEGNTIEVIVNCNDTIGLYGKFTHQIVITDLMDNKFIVDLGNISIKPQIK